MKANIYELMQQVNGTTFISIDTDTIVALRKTMPTDRTVANPHHGTVHKITKGNRVMVFQNKTINGYEAMVQRRLEQEGKKASDFELGPRSWGSRIPNTPFVEHKGEYYLEVIFLAAGESHYEYNGKLIEKDKVIGLDAKKEGHQGGLDNKVIIRTFKIDSITRLTINKKTYTDLYFNKK